MTEQPTLAQRRIIYQARRGLKELDYYIDPYVKQHYLTADGTEQATFELLLRYEDPDLLLYFLEQAIPDNPDVAALIQKIKTLKHKSQLCSD